jgi:stage II sporulation protein D
MRPPRALPTGLPGRQLAAALSCAVLTACLAAAAAAVGAGGSGSPSAATRSVRPTTIAAGTEITHFSPTGKLSVYWRGNGHGHGMSQYGARGAALKGLSTQQILAFYYPGTRLATLPASVLRVELSVAARDTTVLANARGLALSGFGTMPTRGYDQFRLVPSGSGLAVQGHTAAGRWRTLRSGLPSRADFSSGYGWVELVLSDGSTTRYHGRIGAVRSGSGELTINRVHMEQYVQGSVPREVPSSWPAAAVQAQAIAARTYADVSRIDAGSGSQYDICDTSMCQMYGGMAHYDSSGNLLYRDDPAATSGNGRVVLRYQGRPVFAQYSASNGGATVDGGEPYLIGRNDPYDTAASGDPYLSENERVRAAALAAAYNLKSVDSVQVTKRDGNGPWGGRIVTAIVNGRTFSGKVAHVSTTGFGLGSAFGVYTDYLRVGS